MQSNASFADESDPGAKLAKGASPLTQPTPPAQPLPATNAALHPALKPIQRPPQTHPYAPPDLGTQSPIHPHLRASSSPTAGAEIMQGGPSPPSDGAGPVPGSSTSSMAAQGLLGHDPDDSVADGRKAKRELSQSKRAAQNRAAQRAFRQRKEHYIKKLEQQVREYTEKEHTYKAIQNDNYALREYVIQLQSRLLDLQVELPQPPPNVNISPPAPTNTARHAHTPAAGETGPSATAAGTLADVAAAVAGLRAREPSADGSYSKPAGYKTEAPDESHTAEEIRRQLQQENGLPPPSSLRA
ncbi:hypothetical protein F4780DRAFT_440145 [Xylariomycetidae sp. FL0641]|nr:hypothetical protein F4780DRAFT_440145 [Xylariomycetidae sp. FL0641]